ncbi:conjugal transfer protein TraF (plasmid) [Vibrio scophthalmi]|uniref:conjugal transfer protein TraF n=1 Tax=Vibrio scophthalmi TaxID=45658 RepID=UPI003EC089B8
MKSATLTVLILINPLTAFADSGFLDDSSEATGWHFYAEEPEQPIPEKPKLPPSTPVSTAPAGPAPMSTEWIRTNFPKFVNEAIDDPSPENIKRARYVNRVIMDKSSAFKEAWMQDVINNPYLDETQARPVSRFALSAKSSSVREATKEALSSIASKAGLWFFYRSDCPYCDKQAPIVKLYEDMGFNIAAISLDGKPMPNGLFPKFVTDTKNLHKELGVVRVPSLFLVSNDGQMIAPISHGIMTQSNLERIVLIQSKEAGYITPEQFNQASSVSQIEDVSGIHNMDPNKAVNDATYLYEKIEEHIKSQMESP